MAIMWTSWMNYDSLHMESFLATTKNELELSQLTKEEFQQTELSKGNKIQKHVDNIVLFLQNN